VSECILLILVMHHTPRASFFRKENERNRAVCILFYDNILQKHINMFGVKGSWPGRTGVTVLPRGDTDGLRRALVILQGW